MSEPSTVIFDFDGTLVSRDSLLDFCFAYSVRRPWRIALALVMSPLALMMLARSQGAAGSVLLWAMTVGTSTRRFVLSLRRYARVTLPAHAFESLFLELQRHLAAGDRVLIATGSLPPIVRGLLAARGLPPLPVVGSRLRKRFGGLVVWIHCVHSIKVVELRRRFGLERWQHVYTNSFSDAPLIARATDVTLVCPSDRTVLATQDLLGPQRPFRVERPTS
jgi:phosphatidylglycerophosphatase C